MNHTQYGNKIATVLGAWTELRPEKSFGGMTDETYNGALYERMG